MSDIMLNSMIQRFDGDASGAIRVSTFLLHRLRVDGRLR
jgi:hypothetical protein